MPQPVATVVTGKQGSKRAGKYLAKGGGFTGSAKKAEIFKSKAKAEEAMKGLPAEDRSQLTMAPANA